MQTVWVEHDRIHMPVEELLVHSSKFGWECEEGTPSKLLTHAYGAYVISLGMFIPKKKKKQNDFSPKRHLLLNVGAHF